MTRKERLLSTQEERGKERRGRQIKDEVDSLALWSVTADKVEQNREADFCVQSHTHQQHTHTSSVFITACSVITVQLYDI